MRNKRRRRRGRERSVILVDVWKKRERKIEE